MSDRPDIDPMDSDPYRNERQALKEREDSSLKILRQTGVWVGESKEMITTVRESVKRIEKRIDDFEACIKDLEDQIDGCPLRKVETRGQLPVAGGLPMTAAQMIVLKVVEHPILTVLVLALVAVVLILLGALGVNLGDILNFSPLP